eukprot:5549484-Pleurochrysis_carterae.AAC.1
MLACGFAGPMKQLKRPERIRGLVPLATLHREGDGVEARGVRARYRPVRMASYPQMRERRSPCWVEQVVAQT